jgi:hypothetical protein
LQAIVAHLQTTQPVKTWIDSAEIEGGSRFSEEIEQGVLDSVVLVLATRNYSNRPWCRKELLLAKRHQRPLVIIEALEGLDPRSFPYGGNAPRLRWSEGGAERAVDLILKETLRHLHARHVLKRRMRPGDVVISAPPELATGVPLTKGTAVLHPDRPIGDKEMDELKPLGLRVEISRQLPVRGARLEYGGNLGAAGYTVALFDMARAYSALSGLPSAERIINDVGWPLPLQTLPATERAKHQAVAIYCGPRLGWPPCGGSPVVEPLAPGVGSCTPGPRWRNAAAVGPGLRAWFRYSCRCACRVTPTVGATTCSREPVTPPRVTFILAHIGLTVGRKASLSGTYLKRMIE